MTPPSAYDAATPRATRREEMKRRETLVTRAWMGLLPFFIAAAPAAAQTYPDKPVKIVLGVPPGGGLDVLVRGIAAELSTRWGQSVVVDNKPGASGLIAA